MIEVYSQKDGMYDFLKILDKFNKQERDRFLEGLHTVFFDPLGKRILQYLAKEKKDD